VTNVTAQELADAIEYHRQRYTDGDPEVTDEEYDNLVEMLKGLAPQHPVLSKVGAPIDRFDAPCSTRRSWARSKAPVNSVS